jgi:rubredoxin
MMRAHVCNVCGYIYEEDRYGRFEDLDEGWACPNCGSEIDTFEEKEIEEE